MPVRLVLPLGQALAALLVCLLATPAGVPAHPGGELVIHAVALAREDQSGLRPGHDWRLESRFRPARCNVTQGTIARLVRNGRIAHYTFSSVE